MPAKVHLIILAVQLKVILGNMNWVLGAVTTLVVALTATAFSISFSERNPLGLALAIKL